MTSLEINNPEALQELEEAFEGYERALLANEPAELDAYFWRSELALRYGVAENLYGYDEISAYRQRRAQQGGAPQRDIVRKVITTFGRDFGTANIDYVRRNGRKGRQSQTWVRMPDGWRIVAAHVSLLQDSD